MRNVTGGTVLLFPALSSSVAESVCDCSAVIVERLAMAVCAEQLSALGFNV